MIYVDEPRLVDPAQYKDKHTALTGRVHRHQWSHMTADTVEELHAFAAKLGLKRTWFQDGRMPHYDIVPVKWRMALEMGAVEVDSREVVRRALACR